MVNGKFREEKIKLFYSNFSNDQVKIVKKYLLNRKKSREEYFKIVFDISSNCNLNCRGCGTNAAKMGACSDNASMSFEDINNILQKIYEYSQKHGVKPFIYLGGGEPLLHPEIVPIVKRASKLFGKNIGIDTNATIKEAFNTIVGLMPYLSYVGISLNGLKEYHNWWTKNEYSFDNTKNVINKLCSEGLSDYFEVTSIATKKNIGDYEKFLHILKEMEVSNFSIHRAMPVGRMFTLMDLIPNNVQYFELLCIVADNVQKGYNIHLHHSLEEIHSALLLEETKEYSNFGNPEKNSSICINFDGNVYFDPWSTSGLGKNLNAGNLLNIDNLDELLAKENTYFYEVCESVRSKKRCNLCPIHCSGGSRIAAASNEMFLRENMEFLESLLAIDPACPLYE